MRFNLAVIEKAFLDAAVDPSRWNAAMDAVGAATGSIGAVLLPSPGVPMPIMPRADRLQPSVNAYLSDSWHLRDLRNRGMEKLRRDRIATDLDAVTLEEMANHEYYRGFLEPFNLRWFAGVKVVFGTNTWVLSIQRTIAEGPFAPDEQAELQCLSRALSTAGALVDMMGFARAEAALDAFETCGTAAVMLDRQGDVICLNAAARNLLGPDLQISHRRVTPTHRDAATKLDRALHRLLWSTSPSVLAEPIVFPRREGAPILAYPMRLESVSRDALAPCRALLLLRDMGERPLPPLEALRSGFGLTAAEAKLAQRIAGGESLDNAAGELGVAVQTARNQLKAVFSKTGVARQSELVALMARMLTVQERQ